jgi:hypothetical protein
VVLVGTASHFGSLRVTCDVPVVLALRAPTAEALDAVADVLDQHVVVLTRDPDEVPWTTAPEPVVESTVSHTNYELQRIPRTLITRNYNWYAGVVTPAGTVEPLRAP